MGSRRTEPDQLGPTDRLVKLEHFLGGVGVLETARRRIEVRMTRQQLLLERENPLQVKAVLGEAALRTTVGDAATKCDQLRRLVEFAGWPNITIQVIPFDAGPYPAMGSPFDLLGFAEEHYDDVAYVENLRYGLLLEEPATVQSYRLYFKELCDVALGPDESIAMIAKVAEAAA